MRKCGRVVLLFVLSLLSTAVLGVGMALMSAVSLAATALIVPGTGTPDANIVGQYRENFRDYYIAPPNPSCAADSVPACDLVGIDYPASFWPLVILPGWCVPGRCEKFDVSVAEGVDNLDATLAALLATGYTDPIIVAGYSQGARVVTIEKINIGNGAHGDLQDQIAFNIIGNTNRPNGGILTRFGILGHIPILDVTTGQPTPTDTGYATTDYAIRWEGIADMTLYPANPLSLVNSLLGFWFDHGTYLAINENSDPGELPGGWPVELWQDFIENPGDYPDIVDVQVYGDTTYYTITPRMLPISRAVAMIPLIGTPLANLTDPALRVIIEETGYDRDIPFGQPTRARLIPIFNPITLAIELVPAIIEGIENALAGGAPLPTPISDMSTSTLALTSSAETEAVAGSEDVTEGLRTLAVEDDSAAVDQLADATADNDAVTDSDEVADSEVVTDEEEAAIDSDVIDETDGTKDDEISDIEAEDSDTVTDDDQDTTTSTDTDTDSDSDSDSDSGSDSDSDSDAGQAAA